MNSPAVAADPDPPSSFRDPAGPWIDAAIVLTLLIAAVGVARAYLEQHAFDSVVEAAYRAVSDPREARIAMPESMRRAVPHLLALDSRPILFDPTKFSAQGLARRGATHVLAADPSIRETLGTAVSSSRPIGDLELLTLDRVAALQESLPPGRRIIWLDSRPYRYRPVSDSTVLENETPMVFEAVLDPGRYEFRFDAFARNPGIVESRVDLPGTEPRRHVLAQLAFHPFVHSFEWAGSGPRRVEISLRASLEEGPSRPIAFIHRAELSRRP